MKKPKRGAPVKPPEDRKSNILLIRMTDMEKEECEAAASQDGVKMATWARQTLTSVARRRKAKNSG